MTILPEAPVTATMPAPVRIVHYVPDSAAHRDGYRALNLEWIEQYFVVEDRDRRELDDPEGHILAAGGQIFMAEVDTAVLGTCALLRELDGAYELAKMAVDATARGRGVGRALGAAAIAAARAADAPHVDLLSNTVLGPAIALYRALGFLEVPLPATEYARANIKMVLDLTVTLRTS